MHILQKQLSSAPSLLCCIGSQIWVRLQSNATCNIYIAQVFLYSLSQQQQQQRQQQQQQQQHQQQQHLLTTINITSC